MTDLLDHKEITKFNVFMEKEFPKTPFFEFSITNIFFNSNEKFPELEITVSHFAKLNEIIFSFKDFTYYFVTNESYQPWFKSDRIFNLSFFEILKSNVDKNDKNLKNFLEEGLDFVEIYKFRIVAQNFMVDIFTSVVPDIIIN